MKKKIWEDKKSILSSMLAEKPEEVMEIVNGAASLALMANLSESRSKYKSELETSSNKSFDLSKILLSQPTM